MAHAGRWPRSLTGFAAVVGFAAASTAAAALLVESRVEWLSLRTTVQLGLEVTVVCLLLAFLPALLVLRFGTASFSGRALLLAAGLSLFVPTIARSLSFAALFAYYGPISGFARYVGLWPEGVPLESSHLAVVVSLVTLYLPFAILILAQGARALGRSPEIASTLGASTVQRLVRVVIPGLARPMVVAGLVIFSQVLGVIVTPRVLGSEDVTLAVLIDDLLKRTLETTAAVRLTVVELLIALPLALLAARFLQAETLKRTVPVKQAPRSRLGAAVALGLAAALAVPPLVVLLLSVADSPVLSLGALAERSPTLAWYVTVITSRSWYAVAVPSLLVWGTAAMLAIGAAGAAALGLSARPWVRSSVRVVALTILFVPHNALAVVLFIGLAWLPQDVLAAVPAWAIGGAGQAVPAAALAFLLLDSAVQRVQRSSRVAAALGASPSQRLRRIAAPQAAPAVLACFVVSALITLDDVVFVRYLPSGALNTFATELFARARYAASPEMAAACASLWGVVLVLLTAAALAARHSARAAVVAPLSEAAGHRAAASRVGP